MDTPQNNVFYNKHIVLNIMSFLELKDTIKLSSTNKMFKNHFSKYIDIIHTIDTSLSSTNQSKRYFTILFEVILSNLDVIRSNDILLMKIYNKLLYNILDNVHYTESLYYLEKILNI